MKILCDTHSHTVASTHAFSTVNDYIRDAKAKGLQLFSVTDHAPAMPDSPHPWHFGNMKVIPRVVDNIGILRGIEANILPEPFEQTGKWVDLPSGMMAYLDFAIASFHEPVIAPRSRQENTRMMINAIESGLVQIVGHPGNPNYPIDQDEVVRAAKDNNVLLEINNSSFYMSRTGSNEHCTSLLEVVDRHDWKISVGSDAHISLEVGHFDYAIEAIRKVGFPEDRIATLNPARFLAFLGEHDKPVSAELNEWATSLSA
ncbi:phosphatase [Reinekea blandensis]|uniref:Polymerase/histidinol phosphatase N-terminal domain-containing protein n=1 Tax=Reinekea blandensis MED297 TaxID=314283 RepID=A4BBC0_9GAMM|nr:phosphatase [Reinekea blandensis]EAR10733.1 hypothetical protein MED297_11975 [Reinekea sp. MED297] [Reinekea blandensis MED297]